MKTLSKHRILKRLIKISDNQCICNYYSDPVLSIIPSPILHDYLSELAADGYLKKNLRHVVLTCKGYQYPTEHRKKVFMKVLTILGRPIGWIMSWLLGIASALLIEYLIRHISW